MRFLVTARLSTLPDPIKAWDQLASALQAEGDILPIPALSSLRNEEGENPGSVGATIVPMAAIDGSYSVSTASGLASFSDPRLPAVMVAIGYLETIEGPLWNAVRGAGYAYGSHFSRSLDAGLLCYRVYRAPDASKAITASKEAILKIADGEVPIDKHLLEGTVSQLEIGRASCRERV